MIKAEISPAAVLLMGLLCFFCGMDTLFALFSAIAVHESAHILSIRLFGGRVRGIKVSISGLCISHWGLNSVPGEIISLLSGALSGLVFAYAASYFGNKLNNSFLLKTAGISLALSVYNLLPALPLDGGRALKRIIGTLISEKAAESFLNITGILSGAALIVIGLTNMRTQAGISAFCAGITVIFAQALL